MNDTPNGLVGSLAGNAALRATATGKLVCDFESRGQAIRPEGRTPDRDAVPPGRVFRPSRSMWLAAFARAPAGRASPQGGHQP
jgi:hypothetical protein